MVVIDHGELSVASVFLHFGLKQCITLLLNKQSQSRNETKVYSADQTSLSSLSTCSSVYNLIRSTLAMTSWLIWRSWSLVFHPPVVAQQKLRTQQEALTKPWLGAGLRFMKGDWHLNFEIKWVPRGIKHKPTNLWYIWLLDTTTRSQKSPEWIGEWITSLLPWDWTHQSTSSWLFSMVLPHSDKGKSWWASRVPILLQHVHSCGCNPPCVGQIII